MKLEAWPGGRWYRDLGGNNGHFWEWCSHQAATLLEITGIVMSLITAVSNVQYRLERERWWNTDQLSSHGRIGLNSGRSPQGVQKVVLYKEHVRQLSGSGAFRGIRDRASGGTDLPILHRQRSVDSRRFHVTGGLTALR